ncbi:hypothetical protein LOAG_03503 [Loa loa]|uniref:POP1 domain-containing protein n=1 Tax=Loa loa TaxID=7209 RepID=A0A1I7VEW3_LOALO|nr:hypothetical protein LOAG_03503 [Loa loa]EFO24978.2 hypothetical protein LOAG_03503 [Loa loa]
MSDSPISAIVNEKDAHLRFRNFSLHPLYSGNVRESYVEGAQHIWCKSSPGWYHDAQRAESLLRVADCDGITCPAWSAMLSITMIMQIKPGARSVERAANNIRGMKNKTDESMCDEEAKKQKKRRERETQGGPHRHRMRKQGNHFAPSALEHIPNESALME